MPFKILFKGLVCHVTEDDGRETAVFIAGPPEPRHELRLIAPTERILEARCREDRSSAPEGSRAFVIERKILSIGGLGNTKRVTSKEFDFNVPALLAFASCPTLGHAIAKRQLTKGISGYLDHPAGRFDVVSFFKNKARFTAGPEPRERCVASVVSLTLPSGDQPVTIYGRGVKLVFRPDSTIRINNLAFGAVGLMNDHFHHYASVLPPKCVLEGTVIEINESCSGRPTILPSFPTVECSNSHVP